MTTNSEFEYDLGVVGLGYVGLPLAVEASIQGLSVIGYDINSERVEMINNGISPIEDISNDELSNALEKFFSTLDGKLLSKCQNIVISVPTPLTDYQPDLSYVISAAKTVGNNLVKNQVVILESTTYPGTTIEVLIPNLESTSKLKAGEDFFVGYSPEIGFKNSLDLILAIFLEILNKECATWHTIIFVSSFLVTAIIMSAFPASAFSRTDG